MKKLKLSLISLGLLGLISCANNDSQAAFTSTAPRKSDDLIVPPGLSTPDLTTKYKMAPEVESSYQVLAATGMHLASGGDQRWLVIESQTVNKVWPSVLAYLEQSGLTVKYQNPAIGVLETDWASRNTKIPQGGIRGVFEWLGLGDMYSLSSRYMYRILIWQDKNNVIVMNTNYQMDEEYEGGNSPGLANTSRYASSDQQRTKWVARASNPQLELEFLSKYMVFAGITEQSAKQQQINIESAIPLAKLTNYQIIVNDNLDQVWWRTAIALDRIGLTIVDKNRSTGEYFVIPQPKANPDPGLIDQMVDKKESGISSSIPKAKYVIKLIAQAEGHTQITMQTIVNNSQSNPQDMLKYLQDLTNQLK